MQIEDGQIVRGPLEVRDRLELIVGEAEHVQLFGGRHRVEVSQLILMKVELDQIDEVAEGVILDDLDLVFR